ncbi:hypothetical protein KPH14_004613 [Odynerus spinipes]|uniref:Uncharacterized protein n=1 Tax=Odynerus spinipes TaxID=1348599 RepID=A0AAD9RM73_9HYME|nr:hypothetical protein KPH14_004613 [Odynerus spinipes]
MKRNDNDLTGTSKGSWQHPARSPSLFPTYPTPKDTQDTGTRIQANTEEEEEFIGHSEYSFRFSTLRGTSP